MENKWWETRTVKKRPKSRRSTFFSMHRAWAYRIWCDDHELSPCSSVSDTRGVPWCPSPYLWQGTESRTPTFHGKIIQQGTAVPSTGCNLLSGPSAAQINLVGGWLIDLPLRKMMKFVSWDDYSIPNTNGKSYIKWSSHHQPATVERLSPISFASSPIVSVCPRPSWP